MIPLIIANDKRNWDYEGQANHFNKLFVFQCTPVDNYLQIFGSFVFNVEAKFSSFTSENNDILKIINNLNISKTHFFNDILVRMTKLCDGCLAKHLSIIFQNCINSDVFPDCWKNQILSKFTIKIINS